LRHLRIPKLQIYLLNSNSNSSYLNHLNRANCIFSPVITESDLETITPTYSPGPDGVPGSVLKLYAHTFLNPLLNFFICLPHHLFFPQKGG